MEVDLRVEIPPQIPLQPLSCSRLWLSWTGRVPGCSQSEPSQQRLDRHHLALSVVRFSSFSTAEKPLGRDLVLWSRSCQRVFIVIGEAFQRKRLRYADLAAVCIGVASGDGLQKLRSQFFHKAPKGGRQASEDRPNVRQLKNFPLQSVPMAETQRCNISQWWANLGRGVF